MVIVLLFSEPGLICQVVINSPESTVTIKVSVAVVSVLSVTMYGQGNGVSFDGRRTGERAGGGAELQPIRDVSGQGITQRDEAAGGRRQG